MAQGPDHEFRLAGGEGLGPGGASVPALRQAIAETRAELARHLSALRHHLFHPHLSSNDPVTETNMATAKKKTTRSSAGGGSSAKGRSASKASSSSAKGRASADSRPSGEARKPSASSKPQAKAGAAKSKSSASASARKSGRAASASGSSRTRSRSTRKEVKSLVAKTGEVLDTMVAGAVVGAVTGAARAVGNEPTAVSPADPASLASAPVRAGGPGTKQVLGELASGAAVGAVSGAAKSVLPPEKPTRSVAAKKTTKK